MIVDDCTCNDRVSVHRLNVQIKVADGSPPRSALFVGRLKRVQCLSSSAGLATPGVALNPVGDILCFVGVARPLTSIDIGSSERQMLSMINDCGGLASSSAQQQQQTRHFSIVYNAEFTCVEADAT